MTFDIEPERGHMQELDDEVWCRVEGTDYMVSSNGLVYNTKTGKEVRASKTAQGDLKVNLLVNGNRYTRSVRVLVAEAFVTKPNRLCDTVMVLDGNQNNVAAYNLAWRPRWLAWSYARQLKDTPHPDHYLYMPVMDMETGICYNSIVEAGKAEGLLFDDIWRSYLTQERIHPYNGPFVQC